MTATKLRAAVLSDVGRARDRNEDAQYAGTRVFAVADGLGGHRAGEVASQIAIAAIAPLDQPGATDAGGALEEAVHTANREVFERAQHEADLRGMGTTISAVAIDGSTAHVAHVGDSRLYLIRDGAISQITQDHTLVARMVAEGKLTPRQAETHPQRSILTRALGAGADVEVDVLDLELFGGDRLLLCSDGLTATLSDEELRVFATRRDDLETICRALVDEANARGGPDNVTVLLVAVEGPRHRVEEEEPAEGGELAPVSPPRRRRRIPVRWIAWVATMIVLIVAAFSGLRMWVDRSWYVGVAGDRVAIYRGLPTDAFGNRLHKVEDETNTKLTSVAPYYRPRLEEGIRVKDHAAAHKLADDIPLVATPKPTTPSPSPTGPAR